MSNWKYGKLYTDDNYIYNIVVRDCQDMIDSCKATMDAEGAGDCYCTEGMKDTILDYLDEIKIYPDDIDKVMRELDF